jgi:hypothetical protein
VVIVLPQLIVACTSPEHASLRMATGPFNRYHDAVSGKAADAAAAELVARLKTPGLCVAAAYDAAELFQMGGVDAAIKVGIVPLLLKLLAPPGGAAATNAAISLLRLTEVSWASTRLIFPEAASLVAMFESSSSQQGLYAGQLLARVSASNPRTAVDVIPTCVRHLRENPRGDIAQLCLSMLGRVAQEKEFPLEIVPLLTRMILDGTSYSRSSGPALAANVLSKLRTVAPGVFASQQLVVRRRWAWVQHPCQACPSTIQFAFPDLYNEIDSFPTFLEWQKSVRAKELRWWLLEWRRTHAMRGVD